MYTNCNTNRLRIASFNVALHRDRPGALAAELATPGCPQAAAVAEIIQRLRPDVLLLNEFDDCPGDHEYSDQSPALAHFHDHYLRCPQRQQPPINYRYRLSFASNTGIASPVDLDGDGVITLPGDGFGYGAFPGQYGFALLSHYRPMTTALRSLRQLLWHSMPGALLSRIEQRFSTAARELLRLSSKSHIDLPLLLPSGLLHVLLSHPTPPALDNSRGVNRLRNHDELRLWADYLSPGRDTYIVDQRGQRGGLAAGERFVLLGDLNADPHYGDSELGAIDQILHHPRLHSDVAIGAQRPQSAGALQRRRPFATASFNNALRVDYVLPSADLAVCDSGVFWPSSRHSLWRLVANDCSSDHRLVWVDVIA